jgi:hypothetical protein
MREIAAVAKDAVEKLRGALLNGPLWQADQFATTHGRLVRKDAAKGDVSGLDFIWVAFAMATQQFHKLMHKMGMRATMSGALSETEMLLAPFTAINATLGERSDFRWQQMTEVRTGHFFGDFRLRFFGAVDHQRSMFNERPFD